MSRRGENIYKRKDGRWEGRYIKGRSPDGKAQYGYVYASSYQEVRARLQRIVGRTLNGEGGVQAAGPPSQETAAFLALAHDWLRSQRAAVKESSWNRYQNTVENYLAPAFGSVPIQGLTQERLESAFEELLLRGGVKGRGMSQDQLAEKANISRSHLSAIEAPGIVRAFSLEAFFNISDALGIDPAELLNASIVPDHIMNGRDW